MPGLRCLDVSHACERLRERKASFEESAPNDRPPNACARGELRERAYVVKACNSSRRDDFSRSHARDPLKERERGPHKSAVSLNLCDNESHAASVGKKGKDLVEVPDRALSPSGVNAISADIDAHGNALAVSLDRAVHEVAIRERSSGNVRAGATTVESSSQSCRIIDTARVLGTHPQYVGLAHKCGKLVIVRAAPKGSIEIGEVEPRCAVVREGPRNVEWACALVPVRCARKRAIRDIERGK